MLNQFKNRSNQLELMDQVIDNKQELFLNLKELEQINKLTGGPELGFSAIREMLKGRTDEVHIVDIGFGAGDMLFYILNHSHHLTCPVRLTGIDIMPETLEYIHQHHPYLASKVNLEISDYRDWFEKGNQADIVTANLFCHHLTDTQLIAFFSELKNHARIGAVINDLHRSPISYYGIKILVHLFSKSHFTRNDAPLSVLRGFKKTELNAFMKEAGISKFSIHWKWAFRYLIKINNG